MPSVVIVTKDSTNTPVAAFVRVHDRLTGGVVGQGVTDAITGSITLAGLTSSKVYAVRFDCVATYATGDPDWASVKLLLHGDETPIADSGPLASAITVQGLGGVNNTYKKHGSGSLICGVGTSYLTQSLPAMSGDFTVECWGYSTTSDGFQTLINTNGNYASGLMLRNTSATNIVVYLLGRQLLSATVPSLGGVWHHYAVTRKGSTVMLFLDGALLATGTDSRTLPAGACLVGRSAHAASEVFRGYIDEVRVSDVCRYDAAFTPSTSAFLVGERLTLGVPTGNAQVFDYLTPG